MCRSLRGVSSCVLIAAVLLAGAAASGLEQTPAPAGAARPTLPTSIPIFPLPDTTLFPNAVRPLVIFEPRYRAMIADALKGDRIIGMVRLRPGFEADYEGRPPIDAIGCAGVIVESEELPDGRYTIVLRGFTKFRVADEDARRPYRIARVSAVPESAVPSDDRAALTYERKRMTDLLQLQGIELEGDLADEEAVDTVAQYVEMEPTERQALLEMPGPLARVRAIVTRLDRR